MKKRRKLTILKRKTITGKLKRNTLPKKDQMKRQKNKKTKMKFLLLSPPPILLPPPPIILPPPILLTPPILLPPPILLTPPFLPPPPIIPPPLTLPPPPILDPLLLLLLKNHQNYPAWTKKKLTSSLCPCSQAKTQWKWVKTKANASSAKK